MAPHPFLWLDSRDHLCPTILYVYVLNSIHDRVHVCICMLHTLYVYLQGHELLVDDLVVLLGVVLLHDEHGGGGGEVGGREDIADVAQLQAPAG